MATIKSIIETLFFGFRWYVPKKRQREYDYEYMNRKTYNKKFADRYFPKYIDFDKIAKKPKDPYDILLINYWRIEVPDIGLKNTKLLKDYVRHSNKHIRKSIKYKRDQKKLEQKK